MLHHIPKTLASIKIDPRGFTAASNPLAGMINNYVRDSEVTYLRKYGLYFEDCFLDYKNPKLDLAIKLLPLDVQQDRLRRIQRAGWLSVNHIAIDGPLQDYDPHNSYGLLDIYYALESQEQSDKSYM